MASETSSLHTNWWLFTIYCAFRAVCVVSTKWALAGWRMALRYDWCLGCLLTACPGHLLRWKDNRPGLGGIVVRRMEEANVKSPLCERGIKRSLAEPLPLPDTDSTSNKSSARVISRGFHIQISEKKEEEKFSSALVASAPEGTRCWSGCLTRGWLGPPSTIQTTIFIIIITTAEHPSVNSVLRWFLMILCWALSQKRRH